MRENASKMPVRVGFTPTFLQSTSPRNAPSARKYAALEMSPGTSTSMAVKSLSPTNTSVPATRMSAPIAASMRSVWSRVLMSSCTSVSPLAPSAARMTALLTCALATLVSTRAPQSLAAAISTGAQPFCVRMSAPNRRRGAATRSIGRRERESSPVSRAFTPLPETNPIRRRIVVPLLPQYKSALRNLRVPLTRMQFPSTATSAPRARIQAAVERQSSPSRAFVTSASPSAAALNMTARWVMDLSPGMTNSPENCLQGSIFMRGSPATVSNIPQSAPPKGNIRRTRRAPWAE